MRFIVYAAALLFVLLSLPAAAQSAYMNKLAADNQTCLDQGVDMLGCTLHYYKQVDSMLNVVYKKLRRKLNTRQQAQLKSEQLAWLKKRDALFKKYDARVKENGSGTDQRMTDMHYKTTYVSARVWTLINRLEASK